MTIINHELRSAYLNAPEPLKDIVNSMYKSMYKNFQSEKDGACFRIFGHMSLDKCDGAENLVDQIFLFVCESNGIEWKGFIK